MAVRFLGSGGLIEICEEVAGLGRTVGC